MHLLASDTFVWSVFGGIVGLMLLLDLFVFHRKSHVISVREALRGVVVWMTLAVAFMVLIYFRQVAHETSGELGMFGLHKSGLDAAAKYLSCYILEQSLSVDNMFVFLVVFTYFGVPEAYRHKVLFWGIFGAVVMRALFIGAGVVLVSKFAWMTYLFGALLIYTGWKVAFNDGAHVEPEKNPVLRLSRKVLPIARDYDGDRFTTRHLGKFFFTPLFVVLIIIETTDVMFAIDSIPAAFGQFPANEKPDLLIIFSSNIFAILGLRALYFAVAGMMQAFSYLNYGLGIVLAFTGVKMLLTIWDIHVSAVPALSVIIGVLTITILLSIYFPRKVKAQAEAPSATGEGARTDH